MLTERINKIQGLYRELLGREADEPGLKNYVNSDLSIEHIRDCIENSNEYFLRLKKIKCDGVVIFDIDNRISIALLSNNEELNLDFNKVDVIHITNGKVCNTDSSHYHKIESDMCVLSVDSVLEFISLVRNIGSDRKIVVASESFQISLCLVVLWFLSTGLDEESSKNFVFSKIEGCSYTEIESMIGPWHIDAAIG